MSAKIRISYLIALMCFYVCLGKERDKNYSDCREDLYNIGIPSIEEFKELMQKFINKVMQVIQNTDPISVDHLDLNHHTYGIESEGFFNNLLISGTSSTKVNHIDVSNDPTLNLVIDITIKNFQLLGSYKLNFSCLTMLPIYGEGDLGIAMSGFNYSVKTTLKELMDKRLQMTDFHVDFNLNNTKVDISSIFNSTYRGVYLSRVLSELLPVIFNDVPTFKTISKIGSMAALNTLMCDYALTLSTVVEFMTKFIG